MKHRIVLAALLLAGCAARTPPPSVGAAAPMREAGLGRVVGHGVADLTRLFGPADLDAHEGKARRLQFSGPACVLDVYLYPPAAGGDPVASYVDARTPKGDDFDRASCVAALSRREQAP